MIDITFEHKERTVKYTEITFDGIVLPDDGVELLESAVEADGMFNAIVINNGKLRDGLEEKGYIRTNARGGSYGTDKLKDAYKVLLDKLSDAGEL